MDDGYSPWSLLLLLVIIVLEIVFYGFGEAVQKLNTSELLKRKEEGDKKATGILKIMNRSFTYSSVVLAAST